MPSRWSLLFIGESSEDSVINFKVLLSIILSITIKHKDWTLETEETWKIMESGNYTSQKVSKGSMMNGRNSASEMQDKYQNEVYPNPSGSTHSMPRGNDCKLLSPFLPSAETLRSNFWATGAVLDSLIPRILRASCQISPTTLN